MNDQILAIGLGFVVGGIATRLTKWWAQSSPRIEETLNSLDDKLAAKLNLPLSDSLQNTWHSLVHGAVSYVNHFASDGRFWREVIRAIVLRDPSKAVLLQQELAGLSWDKGIAAVEAMMSPELKSVVNTVKEDIAVKVVQANATTASALPSPDPLKAAEQMRAAIRAVAPAHKPEEGPVTKDVIERLIIESQERQARLGGAK